MFSLILAENPLFFPDFPDWKKSSKFSLNSLISLIGGNPAYSFYHPQRSWGKVIFSQASVILFTGGELLSQHALQMVSQHALQQVLGGRWYPSMPCMFPGPHPRGKFRGIWSRPTAKGEVEGIWSRPTAKGEVEGDLVQAHTQVRS